VRGDASRLQQVFWNLLTNAVKFTLPGGDIDVSLTRTDSNLEISVADSGIGIEPEFLPHVFERFRQADSSTTRRYGGLGLGLALVKHLVELHGGTVTALSAGEDRGSTFKVVLPLAADLDSPPADRLPPGSFAPPNLELPGLNGVTALLVDDDPDALVMVSKLIERQGGRAIAAANAGEALKALETQAVDILVSDIGMPDMDGHTLIKRIRSSEATTHRSIPAIALTAHVRADERQRILSAGYQMHLSKPVELRELIAGIASLVRVVKPKF
jgi:CheY-like chemotaxis protein